MIPTKKYFIEMIEACKAEQEKLRLDHARQDGVIRFCQMMIEKQIYVQEEASGSD